MLWLLLLWPLQLHAAPITLTFEDLPEANLFLGGGANIDTFYAGLTFGPDVTGLSASRFGYNDLGYPAHSADTVVTSAFLNSISVDFAAPILSFSIWYSSFDPLGLNFFDAGGGLLGSLSGLPNTDGVFGTSDLLQFSAAGISRVTVDGTAGLFVLDDLTYDAGDAPAPVPEPATLLMMSVGLGGLLEHRRRRRLPKR